MSFKLWRTVANTLAISLFLASPSLVAGECSSQFNHTQSNTNYGQMHFRDYTEYLSMLPPKFGSLFDKKNLRVLDSGGGYGFGILRLSLRNQNETTVINSQNFWEHFKENLVDKRAYEISTKEFSHSPHIVVNGISTEFAYDVLNTFRLLDGQRFPEFQTELRDSRRAKYFQELFTKAYQFVSTNPKFDYKVGFAEEVLPKLKKEFDFIIDYYGAYFYSKNRIDILKQYWEKLAIGGTAVIQLDLVTGGSFGNYESAMLSSPRGSNIFREKVINPKTKKTTELYFLEWLEKHSDGQVQFKMNATRHLLYLVLEKKDPAYLSEALSKFELTGTRYIGEESADFHVPINTYQLK